MRAWFVLFCLMTHGSAWAQSDTSESEISVQRESHSQDRSLINVNMALELEGIERSIVQTSEALDRVGIALATLAESDNLTQEQKQVLDTTLTSFDELVVLSKESMTALPGALQQTKTELMVSSESFLADLQFKLLLLVSLITVLLVVVIAAIYWFILRPMLNTLVSATGHVSAMAGAIQVTAEALKSTTDKQEKLMLELEQMERPKHT